MLFSPQPPGSGASVPVLGDGGRVVMAGGRCFCTTPNIRHSNARVGGDGGRRRQLMARCYGETDSESKKEKSGDNKVALVGINLPHAAGLSGPAGL